MFELDLHREPETDDDEDTELKCVDCGSTAIHWQNVRGKWVLYNDKDDKKHFCN